MEDGVFDHFIGLYVNGWLSDWAHHADWLVLEAVESSRWEAREEPGSLRFRGISRENHLSHCGGVADGLLGESLPADLPAAGDHAYGDAAGVLAGAVVDREASALKQQRPADLDLLVVFSMPLICLSVCLFVCLFVHFLWLLSGSVPCAVSFPLPCPFVSHLFLSLFIDDR